ncbi:MAG: hypothetical protein SF069_15300 [Phycisphaerae bacterium]|nr:hypothetical protein [Phycisphaerae bacterium]
MLVPLTIESCKVTLIGAEYLARLASQGGFSAKMVFNEHGAIFFSASCQHRDEKAPGISYEDDYKGNALAAMLAPGRIDVRYHAGFTDRRVGQILKELVHEPALQFLRGYEATYQGRPIGSCG